MKYEETVAILKGYGWTEDPFLASDPPRSGVTFSRPGLIGVPKDLVMVTRDGHSHQKEGNEAAIAIVERIVARELLEHCS